MKKHVNTLLLVSLCWLTSANGATNMVDPTRPPDVTYQTDGNTVSGPLTLNAIFIYPGYQMAIINQRMVVVGDQIGDFSVTSITSNAVELTQSGDKKLVLQLSPDIKQRK